MVATISQGRSTVLAKLVARMLPTHARAEIVPEQIDDVAAALASLVETARQQAIAEGVRTVPAAVYSSLLGYFPSTLLLKVRFAAGRATRLTLPASAFTYGGAGAVTLGGVVLFKTERLAQFDLKLWAHELTHVMQFQRWGISGFAELYLRDRAALEREATDNADRFVAWQARDPRLP